jgi:hypothetical protein
MIVSVTHGASIYPAIYRPLFYTPFSEFRSGVGCNAENWYNVKGKLILQMRAVIYFRDRLDYSAYVCNSSVRCQRINGKK